MLKDLLRSLVGIAAPFILIFGGAGIAGLGLEYKIEFLLWTGGISVVSGLIWGCWLLLLNGGWD